MTNPKLTKLCSMLLAISMILALFSGCGRDAGSGDASAGPTDASVQASCSGKTATFVFASTVENPLTMGIHLNHGTSIDDLKMTGFEYSVR